MSGTIARKTETLHVHAFGLWPVCAINFSRDQSSAKLINFLDSRLKTRYSKLLRIEAQGTVNLLLSGTVQYRSEISDLRIRSLYAHTRIAIRVYAYDNTCIRVCLYAYRYFFVIHL